MSENLPATQDGRALAPADNSPFQRMVAHHGGMNVGAVEIESQRAIAEAQGKMVLAKRFPRSNANARAEFMEACADPEFAAAAFYTVKNRGTGPSIRFAEEVARCYQNFDYGHKELSRSEGKSEVEVYAWDMERNNFSRRQITVEHVLDTQDGPRKLKQQADIDNRIANIASKQVRGRILALMPKALVQAGIARCKLTIAGGGETTIGQRVTRMVEAFARFGVTPAHLESYIGHATDSTTIDELADLTGIYNAIKEGAKASDYFKLQDSAASGEGATPAAVAIAAQAKKGAEGAAAKEGATAKPETVATSSTKGSASRAASKETKAESKPTAAPAAKQAQESVSEEDQGSPPDNNEAGEPDDVF